jgi:hypothetical protein
LRKIGLLIRCGRRGVIAEWAAKTAKWAAQNAEQAPGNGEWADAVAWRLMLRLQAAAKALSCRVA